MMGSTHFIMGMILPVLLFWKTKEGRKLKHFKFLFFGMVSGVLVDFDFLAGMLELVYTNNIPSSFKEFYDIGRGAHPYFSHSYITLAIAVIASVIGLGASLFYFKRQMNPLGNAYHVKYSKLIAILMIVTIILPLLLLRLGYRSEASILQYNQALSIVFLVGLALMIVLNLKRPGYLLVFGTGILLHLLCDSIQYWIVPLGGWDPAISSGGAPVTIGLNLYDDSNLLLGGIIEGPFYIFLIAYFAWYLIKGRKKLEKIRE